MYKQTYILTVDYSKIVITATTRSVCVSEQAMSVRLVPQLCGRESRNLKQLLDDLPQDNTLRRLRNYSNLFCVSLLHHQVCCTTKSAAPPSLLHHQV